MWADSGVARLGFGDGASERIAAQRPVTTIKARGLSLPAPGIARVDYDQAERLGVATLKLIAAYAMRLVSGDRSVHKVVLFDEAWFLLASRDGRRLIDRLNRLGRAENATLILATQQLTDVGEIENLIGTRLIFGQETAAEARRALELLGLDAEDRTLVERVRGYRRGRCLIRDIDDRVAELQIEPVHEHVLAILDTSPGRAARAAGGRGVRRRLALILGAVLAWIGLAWPAAVGQVPRHRPGEQHRARVAARGRPGRPLPAVGVLAGLPRRRRRDRPGRGAADDRPVGGRADLERDELPGEVGRGPVHVGVLARPAQRCAGRAGTDRGRDHQPVRERDRRVLDGRGDPRRRPVGDLEGARAAPLHRVGRRARRLGPVHADRAVLRLPAGAHDRRGEPLDEHALAGVPVGRQPRLARRSRAGQAPGRRSHLRDAGLPAVGGARVRRPAPLRRHRPARQGRLPAARRPARPVPRRLPRPPAARSRRARRLRRTVPAPAGRVRGAQGRVRGAAQGRDAPV